MNKYQRAFGIIDTILQLMRGIERKDGYRPTQDEMKESMIILKELVEKATPKKPIIGEDQDVRYASIYECPNCHKMFLGTGTNYCYRCGQALDWGKEDGQDN